MEGFFTRDQTNSDARPDGRVRSCASCGLYRFVLSPRMAPFGNFRKGILNIGEAPGETEDKKGKQWQGKVGKRLQREYKKLGIDLFEDCLNINAVNCRPTDDKGNNREPTNEEIANCRNRVFQIIQERKPHVIVLLGNQAISCVYGHRWKKNLGGITKWRGWTIPDRDLSAWVCPTFHPSFVERSEPGAIDIIWRQDLSQAISKLKDPLPKWTDERQLVQILDSPDDLPQFPELAAFDYETTGLKPHREGHRIVCASIAYDENTVYSFPMPRRRAEQGRFLSFLRDANIKKMAHNMKFEEAWSSFRMRQPVQGWYWDSLQAAHILDNRPGITSLKFQACVHEGVVDYDSEIAPFLDSGSKDGNAFNRVLELFKTPEGRDKLLVYCGLDSLYEYRLAMKQMEIMGMAR